jgi:peptide/nickel transport system substrate-binding protein
VIPNSLSSALKVKARTGTLLLSLLVIFSIVLAACGSQTPTTTNTGPKNTTLTIVPSPVGDFTQAFSPYAPTPSYGTQGLVYETLLFFNRQDGSVKPWLASSYQFASDASSISFTLNQNVKWSDGQPLTSADVVFTLNMLKQYPAADGNNLWTAIKDVQAPDQNTVNVTFVKPFTPILWYLGGQTWIVPQHLFANVGDPTKFPNPNPVGTGPYTLKSFTPQLIDWTKNPHYWQAGKPAIQEIKYPSFNSNTGAELLLARGEVDWTGLFTPNINKTYVSRDPAHNHYWFPPRNVVMLYLNTAKYPFNLLPVRKAISDVLDREQMYKIAESGYEPVASPTALVLPANKSFLASDYANSTFSIDATAAATALSGAGFTKGSDGIYADKSGKKISFSIDVVTGWTDWVTNCQIMSTNLKALGMDVTVNALSFNAYFSALQLGSFDAAISWTNPGPTPFFLYNSMLNSKNTAAVGKAASSNWERWSDPATDQLLNQYATSTDPAAQQTALAGLQKVMVDQLPSIPLVYGATWNEYSTARFTGFSTESNPYALPAPFDYPDMEITVLNLKPVA